MKNVLSVSKKIIVIVVLIMSTSCSIYAQDGEKQRIATVIDDELTAFSNKDRKKWESQWVHSDAVKRFNARADFYSEIFGWDSLSSAMNPYFTSQDEGYKASKNIHDIRIEGNIAIAHASERSDDGASLYETLVLERHGMEWKILEMHFLVKSTYENTDLNIEACLNTQGYNLLSKNKIDDAIKVFKLNTELFPAAFNTWDSLAEAFMTSGSKEKAIEYYQKSLDLNPENDNAKKYLSSLKGEANLSKTPQKN